MAEVRFNLLNPSEPETRVLAVFRYGGQILRYYTGDVVKPRLWNPKAQRFRQSPELLNAGLMNDGLTRLENKIKEIYLEHRNASEALPPDKFRAILDESFKGKMRPTEKPKTVWQFIDAHIDERAAAGNCTESTLETYRRMKKTLEKFDAETGAALAWSKFDRAFSQDFTAWMNGKNMGANYTRKTLSILKTVLKEADAQGFAVPPAYRDQKFFNGLKNETAFSIALTVDELGRLAALDLDGSPRMADVRDLFLFGAFTGLRFSDFSTVTDANIRAIEGQKILQFTAQKTSKKQIVPLGDDALEMLQKRGGNLPRARSNAEMNRVLKDLAALAEIDDEVAISEKQGGFTVRKTVKKSTLVTSHTARRSFATNEYLRLAKAGKSIEPLVQILGHSTEAQTRAYIKADGLNVVLEFAKSRFAKVA